MSTPVRRALYGRLAGDTTLGNMLGAPAAGYNHAIYNDVVPAQAAFPFVVFTKISGITSDTFQDADAIQYDVWLVKGVDRNTTADRAEQVAARLVTLLNDAPLSISGSSLLYLRKRADVVYAETTEGVVYYHRGGHFRLVTD